MVLEIEVDQVVTIIWAAFRPESTEQAAKNPAPLELYTCPSTASITQVLEPTTCIEMH
jgi:hypothetical protein